MKRDRRLISGSIVFATVQNLHSVVTKTLCNPTIR